ncbi:MAG TPA: DUF503 domain-containing protein [Thermoanaerobaculia bacterium]|nr:DUF503 domain-containing protein [Thermoanaerobaculia bacterium]
MIVGVALFELHIEHSRSLKEKRSIVRSVRDRLRARFNLAVAEVGLNELHQRARLAVSLIALHHAAAEEQLRLVASFVEETSDALLSGWTEELFDFDAEANLGIPNIGWKEES